MTQEQKPVYTMNEPWVCIHTPFLRSQIFIDQGDRSDIFIANVADEETAEFIVEACNSHYALKSKADLVPELLEIANRYLKALKDQNNTYYKLGSINQGRDESLISRIEGVIKKAEAGVK